MQLLGKGFADKNVKLKKIRRADNFAKMAVSASMNACADFDFPDTKSDISIILATQFGPHVTTFKFLDDLLDYSEISVSPTIFSHSVHNAAASYIASTLEIIGQTLTITSFIDPLRQALILADAWLRTDQANKIIVCYAEEESGPFLTAHKHCIFPSYSKDTLRTGAAAIFVEKGKNIEIPVKIENPFTYIEEM
ncbi:MAG: beta-ketoacyl synthase chain length factor [Desulfobacteraceae bacterium]|nr:beta-ketoacyl synthase chain length factor [Desulfobacteraceae bacterium]